MSEKIKTDLRCRKSSVLATNCSHRPVVGREKVAMHRRWTAHRAVAADEKPSEV
jgi:hypothetical protein